MTKHTTNNDGYICDDCGELIARPEHGWVEWVDLVPPPERPQYVQLRIVHSDPTSPREGGCRLHRPSVRARGAEVLSHPLESFQGPDGLMRLLSLINEGHFQTTELLELIKRLHIPGYEHARAHFKAAIQEGIFEPNTRPAFYWQSDIQATLRFVAEREGCEQNV